MHTHKLTRALVSGAGGFVGASLMRQLKSEGVHVVSVGRTRKADGADAQIALGEGPWTPAQWSAALDEAQPDAVFHLAGSAKGTFEELEALNVKLAEGLLAAVRLRAKPPRIILTGSAAALGDGLQDGVPATEDLACKPVSAYGRTKRMQTELAEQFLAEGGDVIVARVFNPIGAGMPKYLALPDFAAQIVALPPGGALVTGDLTVARDFIDVAHVGPVMCALARNLEAKGVVNICAGEAAVLRDLVLQMIALSGKDVTLEVDPARLRPGERRVIIGSTARMTALGAAPPPTDLSALVALILADAQARASAA
jgi:GDP-4-dehydro-6-deoxy-D-mannose reductase